MSFDDKEGNWWHDRTIAQKILLGIGFAILGIALLAFLGWVVMVLWNWLMPDLFGLKKIDYWQAWGLYVLSHLLFRGFKGTGGDKSDRKRKRHLRESLKDAKRPESPVEGQN